MRRGAVAAIAGIVALEAAACSLPARDNPDDPSNAPSVQLRVVDFTRADGSCDPGFAAGQSWPVVAAISRGHCLALDASKVSDPGGFPIASFSFARLDTAGNVVETFSPDPSATAAHVLDDTERRKTLPPRQTLRFRATATDDRGFVGHGDTTLVLLNSPPRADAGPATRALPLGGRKWALGAPIAIGFDGSGSSDPDGDPLDYCWTFPGAAAVCSTDAALSQFTRPVAVGTAGRFVASLRVDDGDLTSAPQITNVTVESPTPWVVFGSAVSENLQRFDFNQQIMSLPDSLVGFGISPIPHLVHGAIPAVIGAWGQDFDFRLSVAPLPSGQPFNPTPVVAFSGDIINPSFRAQLTFDPASTAVWAVGYDETGATAPYLYTPMLDRYDVAVAGTGLMLTAGGRVTLGAASIDVPPGTSAISFDGTDVWVGLGTALELVPGGSGTPATVISDPDRLVSQIVTRPGTSETWVLRTANLASSAPGAAVIDRIVGASVQEIADPAGAATSFGFADGERLWLHDDLDGLRLLDVDAFVAGAGIDLATLVDRPELTGAFPIQPILVDPGTGMVWVMLADNVTLSATWTAVLTDGRTAASGLAAYVVADIDASGGLWQTYSGLDANFDNVSAVSRALTPTLQLGQASGIAAATTGGSFPSYWQNDGEGGLYVFRSAIASFYPLAHVSHDGSRIDDVQFVDEDGQPNAPLPQIIDAESTPDHRGMWVVEQTSQGFPSTKRIGFLRTQGGLQLRTLLDESAYASIYNPFVTQPMLVPASPAAPAPFVWTQETVSFGTELATLDTNGTLTQVAPLPNGESLAAGAVFHDDSLCVGAVDLGSIPQTASLRRVDLQGNDTLLAQFAGGAQPDVATTTDGTRELCWVTGVEGTSGAITVVAVDTAGTLVHQWNGSARSLLPVSNDRVWVMVNGASPGTQSLERLDFAPGSVTTSAAMSVALPYSSTAALVRDDAD